MKKKKIIKALRKQVTQNIVLNKQIANNAQKLEFQIKSLQMEIHFDKRTIAILDKQVWAMNEINKRNLD